MVRDAEPIQVTEEATHLRRKATMPSCFGTRNKSTECSPCGKGSNLGGFPVVSGGTCYDVQMPPAKRVLKRAAPSLDLEAQVHDYLNNRSMRERSEWEEGRIKKILMDFIASTGVLQEGGHRVVTLGHPSAYHSYKNGKPQPKNIIGVERKRRVSQSLNPDRTMALLKERKLVDECTTTETIVSIDEDAILAANFEGRISDEELAALYDNDESFAFYLVEGEAD